MMKSFNLWIVFFLWSTALFALPPSVEADRLELAAQSAIDTKDFKSAVEKLEAIQQLDVKLPENFTYYYGIALCGVGKYKESLAVLDKYLSMGKKTKFYKEAMESYNLDDHMLKNIALGIYVDNKAGLMWQDNDAVKTKKLKWSDADKYCSTLNLGGYNNWRLPTITELENMPNQSNGTVGISHYDNGDYWTSSSFVSYSNSLEKWTLRYLQDSHNQKENIHSRCVRTAP